METVFETLASETLVRHASGFALLSRYSLVFADGTRRCRKPLFAQAFVRVLSRPLAWVSQLRLSQDAKIIGGRLRRVTLPHWPQPGVLPLTTEWRLYPAVFRRALTTKW
jgi:hypothetical protein